MYWIAFGNAMRAKKLHLKDFFKCNFICKSFVNYATRSTKSCGGFGLRGARR